jgi:hypothetical protein
MDHRAVHGWEGSPGLIYNIKKQQQQKKPVLVFNRIRTWNMRPGREF